VYFVIAITDHPVTPALNELLFTKCEFSTAASWGWARARPWCNTKCNCII